MERGRLVELDANVFGLGLGDHAVVLLVPVARHINLARISPCSCPGDICV